MKDSVTALENNIGLMTKILDILKGAESVFSLEELQRLANAESQFGLYAPMALEAQRKNQFLPSVEVQRAWMDAQDDIAELCLIHHEHTGMKNLKPHDRVREVAKLREKFQKKDLLLPLNEKIKYLRRWQEAKERTEQVKKLGDRSSQLLELTALVQAHYRPNQKLPRAQRKRLEQMHQQLAKNGIVISDDPEERKKRLEELRATMATNSEPTT